MPVTTGVVSGAAVVSGTAVVSGAGVSGAAVVSGTTIVSGDCASVDSGATVVSNVSGEIQPSVKFALIIFFRHELSTSNALPSHISSKQHNYVKRELVRKRFRVKSTIFQLSGKHFVQQIEVRAKRNSARLS